VEAAKGANEALKSRMQLAVTQGERLELQQAAVSDLRIPNPSTQVHRLIKALQELAGRT
jgi:hypothetical protein